MNRYPGQRILIHFWTQEVRKLGTPGETNQRTEPPRAEKVEMISGEGGQEGLFENGQHNAEGRQQNIEREQKR